MLGIVIWLCKRFDRTEIDRIVTILLDLLYDASCEIKPKDNFKEEHPNYRAFDVDPLAPVLKNSDEKDNLEPKAFKRLLKEYELKHHKALKPVKPRNPESKIPTGVVCPSCHAPSQYLYFNDGKRRNQLKCKVCGMISQLEKHYRKDKTKPRWHCPYCDYTLYKWVVKKGYSLHKCANRKCPCRLKNLKKLNPSEKFHRLLFPTNYAINYIYREFHYSPEELKHARPVQQKTKVDLFKIYNSAHTLGLVLSFYVSFALSARKTSALLKQMFNLDVSRQTVLNYASSAAYYCHQFNMAHKGPIDNLSAGDETYIKIRGKNHYVWFFISSESRVISAYHISDNRCAISAITAIKEAIRTASPEQSLVIITDGNPSYTAALHHLNTQRKHKIKQIKVIGLENLDEESTEYRSYKQIVERLNRTYKHHIRPSAGFNSFNGAMALTTLFVTHYNFLRPHLSLKYTTPLKSPALKNIDTIQNKWIKILNIA